MKEYVFMFGDLNELTKVDYFNQDYMFIHGEAE